VGDDNEPMILGMLEDVGVLSARKPRIHDGLQLKGWL